MTVPKLKDFIKKLLEYLLDQSLKKHSLSSRINYLIKNNQITDVIDVGANEGQFIDEYYNIFKNNNLSIHSYEPINHVYKNLYNKSKSSKLSWNTYNFALGDNNSSQIINISSGDQTSSSLLKIKKNGRIVKEREEEIKVRLFDTIKPKSLGKTFVKIDVQGYEYKVLNGMKKFIKEKSPFIMLEISNVSSYHGGIEITSYLNWFKEANYELLWIHHNIVDIHKDYEFDFCFGPK